MNFIEWKWMNDERVYVRMNDERMYQWMKKFYEKIN